MSDVPTLIPNLYPTSGLERGGEMHVPAASKPEEQKLMQQWEKVKDELSGICCS